MNIMRKNGRKCKCKSRRKRKGTIISLVLIMAMIAMCLQLPSMDTYAGAPGYIPNSGKDGKAEAPLNSEIVGPGGYEVLDGKSYSKIRFLYHHPIFKSYTEDTDSVVYYTDGFFDTSSENSDPRNYNRHIAPASMALAFSGMYLRKDEEADANGNIYYNKHAGVRQFFADMGCPDENIYVNDSNLVKPEADSIGVAIAGKELEYSDGTKTGRVLIPVVVRGGGYEQEWANNVTLGHAGDVEGKEAKGFSESAGKVMDEIHKYIEKYDLKGALDEKRVTFWVTGYSRAGAVANIVSKRLIEEYIGNNESNGNEVISYPCEAPKGGTDDAEKLSDKTAYFRIHNIVNPGDIVPLVAPEEMGFKRYGVDHYIPGYSDVNYHYILSNGNYCKTKKVEKGGKGGPENVTTYSDNLPRYIKDADENSKYRMREQLKLLDPEIEIDDSFRPMTFDIFSFEAKANGNEAGNHVEEFIKDFVYFVQWGNMPGNSNYDWSQAIKNRDSFADDLEPVMRDVMAVMYTMSEADYNSFSEKAGKIGGDIPMIPIIPMYENEMPYLPGTAIREDTSFGLSYAGLYLDVIRRWGHLSQDDRDEYIESTWKIFEQSGALDHIDGTYRERIKAKWPKLIDFIFTYVVADYNYFPGGIKKAVENPPAKWASACIPNEFGVCMPDYFYEPPIDTVTTMEEPNERSFGWASGATESMMYTGTFMTYSNYILQQHYTEVNLAWLRADDSYYYTENATETISTDGYKVSAPAAEITDITEGEATDGEVSEGEAVKGKRIVLSVDDIVGEAIYYDLKNDMTGEVVASNKLYSGEIQIMISDNPADSYTLTTYAMSHGIKSENAVFTVDMTGVGSDNATDTDAASPNEAESD